MATSWTSLQMLSKPQWALTADPTVSWSKYPLAISQGEIGYGEGGYGEGGYDAPAVNLSGLSQPVWTPWTID